jgi:hypothetical protein
MAATPYDSFRNIFTLQRALDRLVPHHDAANRAPAASESVTDRTTSVRSGNIKTAREREALALARQHRRGTRTHRRTKYRTRFSSSVLTPRQTNSAMPLRVRDLHPKQHRIYPELRRTLPGGETISTAFVESTINQVVSKRFVKKQQMQWTSRGAHLLLQTRTKVLNDDLEDAFRGWYPQFHAQAA